MSEEMSSLLDLIQLSVDLSISIVEDLKGTQMVSNETVAILLKFKAKHDELIGILDTVNGMN